MKHADEHFIPGTSRITEIESFHRYHAAAPLCKGKTVLDAACGEGYGSAILAASAEKVRGIDQNAEAVREAKEKYKASNLDFVSGIVEEMPFEAESFDRIVSFETIEHLIDQRKFLCEIRRVLKSDGILILSSPNKTSFRSRNKEENLYHINELEPEQLLELIKEYFPHTALYGQDAFYNSVISGDGANSYLVRDSENNVLWQNALKPVQYSIVLASAKELPSFSPSSFVDGVYDPEKGYLWDDESVPLQFGLRGEFNRQQAELSSLKEINAALASDKELLLENNRKQGQLIEELHQINDSLKAEKESKCAENFRQAQVIENVRQINSRLCEENNAAALRHEELYSRMKTLAEENKLLSEKAFQEKEEKNQHLLTIGELRARQQLLSEEIRQRSEENLRQTQLIRRRGHRKITSSRISIDKTDIVITGRAVATIGARTGQANQQGSSPLLCAELLNCSCNDFSHAVGRVACSASQRCLAARIISFVTEEESSQVSGIACVK